MQMSVFMHNNIEKYVKNGMDFLINKIKVIFYILKLTSMEVEK